MPIRNGRISLSEEAVGSLMAAMLEAIAVSSCPRWLADLELMLETSGRLLRVLALLQSRRDWPGPELAARLGVSPRTLRRDMDKLRSLGYPVEVAASSPAVSPPSAVSAPPQRLLLPGDEGAGGQAAAKAARGAEVLPGPGGRPVRPRHP